MRPESRSVMILTDSTVPHCVNAWVMTLSVVWNDRLPTDSCFGIFLPNFVRRLPNLLARIKGQSAPGQDRSFETFGFRLNYRFSSIGPYSGLSMTCCIHRPDRPKRRPLGCFGPKPRHCTGRAETAWRCMCNDATAAEWNACPSMAGKS
jgi:hypothetical protein